MTQTFKKIATVNVTGSTQSSMDFTNIPQTYNDLAIIVSARSNESDFATNMRIVYNGLNSSLFAREMRVINTTIATFTQSNGSAGYLPAVNSTTNGFGSSTIYIPNYTGSQYKSSSSDTITAANTSSYTILTMSARLWSNTAPITSISITSGGGSWVQYSTASLYGIR
jgi:hypothetical protein